MARQLPHDRGRRDRATRLARRAWPFVLAAWERWQALPEQDKERYRRQVRDYAERGRRAVTQARGTRRGRRGPFG
jgi:hypothetical protein